MQDRSFEQGGKNHKAYEKEKIKTHSQETKQSSESDSNMTQILEQCVREFNNESYVKDPTLKYRQHAGSDG